MNAPTNTLPIRRIGKHSLLMLWLALGSFVALAAFMHFASATHARYDPFTEVEFPWQALLYPGAFLAAGVVQMFRRSELEVDAAGIHQTINGKRADYLWHDIEDIRFSTRKNEARYIQIVVRGEFTDNPDRNIIRPEFGFQGDSLIQSLKAEWAKRNVGGSAPSSFNRRTPQAGAEIMLALGRRYCRYSLYALGGALALATVLLFQPLVNYNDRSILQTRGVATTAIVTWAHSTSRRGSHTYLIRYKFNPNPAIAPTLDLRNVPWGNDSVGKEAWDLLDRGSLIPIVYDPRDPMRSLINFDNRVRNTDPAAGLKFMVITAACLIGFVLVLLVGGFRKAYMTAKARVEREAGGVSL